ncbi:MAG: hypothetical protein ACPGVD_05435 [Flavobacteriales bacterium]
MKKILIVTAVSSLTLFSCKKEKAEEPKPTTPTPISVSFATDIQPIFVASCGTGGSCHGSTSATDGKVFETHAGASAVPGSTIKGSINHDSGFSNMPKSSSKLSSDKISKIEAWIDGGMKND